MPALFTSVSSAKALDCFRDRPLDRGAVRRLRRRPRFCGVAPAGKRSHRASTPTDRPVIITAHRPRMRGDLARCRVPLRHQRSIHSDLQATRIRACHRRRFWERTNRQRDRPSPGQRARLANQPSTKPAPSRQARRRHQQAACRWGMTLRSWAPPTAVAAGVDVTQFADPVAMANGRRTGPALVQRLASRTSKHSSLPDRSRPA